MKQFLSLFLALAALALPAIALGQTPVDEHQRLVDAIASEERLMKDFDQISRDGIMAGFAKDAEMQANEAECPGGIEIMVGEMLPILRTSHKRGIADYRADLLELFRSRLDDATASEAADFYGSDIGRQLLDAVDEHASATNMIASAGANEAGVVSAEAYVADKEATENALRNQLEPVLEREAAMQLAGSEWFPRFMAIQPDMQRVELAFVNGDLSDEETAALDANLDESLTEHFDRCFAQE